MRIARTQREHHRQGIVAAIELGPPNSRLEGLNSSIRLISYRVLGYLCCGGIVIDLPR